MMPQTVPVQTLPSTGVATGLTVMSGNEPDLILTPPLVPSGTSPSGLAGQKSVEINFSADRNQLFSAWNAIANLADLAGMINVTVRADSAEGFDRNKLQNGVLEPLRESDLIE